MAKLKVMTVFGTRPEAIKMCPLVLEMRKHPDEIEPSTAKCLIRCCTFLALLPIMI